MILRPDNYPDDPARREEFLREALPAVREGGVVVVLARPGAKPPRGGVFDLDATLLACEFVDRLAAHLGKAQLTRELTAKAMSGEMDFRKSYLRRMEMLGGVATGEIDRLTDTLPLAPGAARTTAALHRAGIPTAIITGGYARVGRAVQQRLDIDALYATEIEERDGVMTGRTVGPLLDEEGKAEALAGFCAARGLDPAEVMAVGDGANDLKMLSIAGTAVLYTSIPTAARMVMPLDVILEQVIPVMT
jgi:phosphoserine phosphatase